MLVRGLLKSLCIFLMKWEDSTLCFVQDQMAGLDLLLELDYYHGRWIPDMAWGMDHFIGYLHFTATSLDRSGDTPKFIEYFILWTQPTPPYYCHATLVEIVELSSSSSSSFSSDMPMYAPPLTYDIEISKHILTTPLSLDPYSCFDLSWG